MASAVVGFWYPRKEDNPVETDDLLKVTPGVYAIIGSRGDRAFTWPSREKANPIAKALNDIHGNGTAWVHNLTPRAK